jgi:succinate dehydrogenase/fumarate reductase flavoprotein subunit
LQVQLHHHTSNGGIRIDTDAHSPFVRGLFACGEAAGWQGADRLGGTMLGGSQVFGWRAGTKAAEVAKDRPQGELHRDDFERLLGARLARQREAKGGTRPGQLHRELQQAMWERLLVERDAEQLAAAQQVITEQRGRMREHLLIAEPFDHVLALEQRNLLDVAEVITQAATMRTESRGSHYRADYPERDDAHWLSNIFVSRDEGGNLELRKEWINEEVGWEDQGRIRIMPWG